MRAIYLTSLEELVTDFDFFESKILHILNSIKNVNDIISYFDEPIYIGYFEDVYSHSGQDNNSILRKVIDFLDILHQINCILHFDSAFCPTSEQY